MKIFFYMGGNPRNKSGVSWKIWKIQRRGRTVTIYWGPATLVNRQVKPKGTLRSKTMKFRTESEAIADEERRIKRRLSNGYERKPRRK